jgi:hypothetical protein
MPVDVFEDKWKCHKCQAVSLGRNEHCVKCGKIKNDKDTEIQTGDLGPGRGMTNPELLKKFTEGADWVCHYCDGHTRNAMGDCLNCGGGKAQGVSRADRDECCAEDPRDAAVRAYNEKRGYSPPTLEDELEEQGVAARWVEASPPPPPLVGGSYRTAPRTEPTPREVWQGAVRDAEEDLHHVGDIIDDGREDVRVFMPRFPMRGVIIGIAIALLLALLIFLLTPREYDATVDSVRWTHFVVVDRYSTYQHDGFDPPGNAFNIADLGPRVHHYDHILDHYETRHRTRRVTCGQDCTTVQDCHTTSRSCKSNKNGSTTCSGGDRVCAPRRDCKTRYCDEPYTTQEPIYRDEPRYRSYYQWNIWEWAENRRVTETGNTTETFWPSDEKVALNQNLKDGERERSRQDGTYKVWFVADKDRYDYEPSNLSEFKHYALGKKYHIKVTLGSVSILGEVR